MNKTASRLRSCLGAGSLIAATFFVGCQPVGAGGEQAESSIRNKPAAEFNLPDLEGKAVRLRDFRGKVVLLNFWGTTCAPCIQEIPWLIEFQKKYEEKGLQVVAVSMYGEGPDELKPYVAERGMEPLKVLIGNDQIKGVFGARAFPTTFLIDRKGNYHSRHQGLINRKKVEAAIAALLEKE